MNLSNFSRIIKIFKTDRIYKASFRILKRLIYGRDYMYQPFYKYFRNKNGIEIGGPSPLFKDTMKIYTKIKSLDGVNFSASTVWEGKLVEGWNYKYGGNKQGYQYICDAVDLSQVESLKYDFLVSCNNLEHIANPIKALSEWLRIIKSGGVLLLVLPKKECNFDHNRDATTFEHLLDDFESNVSEEDLTHLDEILALHDLSLDPLAGDFENFKQRSLSNLQNRCLHHHVFDMVLLRTIFNYLGIDICLESYTPIDYIILGKKK